MRDHYPYPRKRWHTALGVTTLLLSLGIALGYGIPVNNHQSDINHAQATANAVSDTNHLWNMVGGVEAVDGGDLGRVAAKVREFNNAEPNPLAALQDHYIAPGELPDLGNRLGFTAYSNNHFTDQFLFQAIQAMGVVKGGSAADVVKPVPSVPSYGYLRWDWGLYGLGGLWTLAGLIWLVLRYDKKRYPARARAKEIAALSPEARKTFHIIQRLEEMPRRRAVVGGAANGFSVGHGFTSAPILSVPLEQADSGLDHLVRRDASEAPEVPGFADPLVARAARKAVHFYGNGGYPRVSPWVRPRRQSRAVERHHRHGTGCGDMHRPAVAADEERREIDQGAQLGERELAAREHPLACRSTQPRPRRGYHKVGRVDF